MITFSLENFGCRASQADGAALKRALIECGLAEAPQPDVAILNTCTVTAAADAEIRRVIRRIYRENPKRRILVTGCYAQRAPGEVAKMDGVAWVVGNSDKHLIPAILSSEDSDSAPTDEAPGSAAEIRVGEIAPVFHFLPVFSDDRTRPTLKIQDGCNARCSFCVIPSVRGRSRSLAPAAVIEQINFLERRGYKEVVLSGINLGGYGRDLGRSVTFLGLLEQILARTRIARIRISSIEPMDVSRGLIALAAAEPRLADHFHVPLQSGADRILRQMNRRYWTTQYAERISAIREAMPHCGIGADVMTGFPGETEDDHRASAQFIESLPFTYLHVFPYSARPSTPAAQRADQVNGRIAHERSAELRRLAAAKLERFLVDQLGRVLSAVTLDKAPDEEDGAATALTSSFLTIRLPGCEAAPNQLIDVEATAAHGGRLHGHRRV